MYDDYPIIYETSLNENIIYFLIFGIVLLAIIIIITISLSKIFKKAEHSAIYAIIPVYNIITLLEITNLSKWYLLFLMIPGVNLFFYLSLMTSLANSFRKSKSFAMGLTFLPFIFYPILAFGDNSYIGINLVAMQGKSVVADVPKTIAPEENNPIVHEEKDTSLKNIDISIGGGVYQKDYTKTLMQVNQEQAIPQVNAEYTENQEQASDYKPSFITSVEETQSNEDSDALTYFDKINLVEKKEDPIGIKQEPSTVDILKNDTINTNTLNEAELIEQIPLTKNESSSYIINPENQTSTNKELHKETEFVSCPKCGAKIKGDAGVCFLCGSKI